MGEVTETAVRAGQIRNSRHRFLVAVSQQRGTQLSILAEEHRMAESRYVDDLGPQLIQSLPKPRQTSAPLHLVVCVQVHRNVLEEDRCVVWPVVDQHTDEEQVVRGNQDGSPSKCIGRFDKLPKHK